MGKNRRSPAGSSRVATALLISGAFLALVAALVLAGILPWVVLAGYVILSVISFVAYSWDKSAARRGARRTPESTLHLLALAGGWPGAWLARQTLRHKTIKQPFRRVFWATVAGDCLLLAIYWLGQAGG